IVLRLAAPRRYGVNSIDPTTPNSEPARASTSGHISRCSLQAVRKQVTRPSERILAIYPRRFSRRFARRNVPGNVIERARWLKCRLLVRRTPRISCGAGARMRARRPRPDLRHRCAADERRRQLHPVVLQRPQWYAPAIRARDVLACPAGWAARRSFAWPSKAV